MMDEKERKRLYNAAYYAANKERFKVLNRRWEQNNKEARRQYKQAGAAAYAERRKELDRARYAANPEKYRARTKANYAKNGASWRERVRKYQHANRPKISARNAADRAFSKLATPKWANYFFIEEIYALARLRTQMFGYPWHVDHIVPLRSKKVCGLHWEGNMNVIPGVENNRKYNSQWPDMPSHISGTS
jgi:hypothetical protein